MSYKLFAKYAKRSRQKTDIFVGHESKAEAVLLAQRGKKIPNSGIDRLREILTWKVSEDLFWLAFACVLSGDKPITKGKAVKEFGESVTAACPRFLVKNPHGARAPNMELYYPRLLQVLKEQAEITCAC